jgi:hypothetical protein
MSSLLILGAIQIETRRYADQAAMMSEEEQLVHALQASLSDHAIQLSSGNPSSRHVRAN